MPLSVALRSLRAIRRGIIGWSLGLVGLVAFEMAVFPTVRDDESISKLTQSYPEVIKELFGFGGAAFDFTSPPGYLGAELFSLIVPLLLTIAAIATGAGAIAGEEERGTLDLLLSLPVSRRRVVAEKLGAMAAEIGILGLVLLVALWIGIRAVGMDIAIGKVAAASLAAGVLALGFGALALFVGAATGSRGTAIGVTAALATAAYLVNSLAALVSWLGPAQRVTPFYHYASPEPLRNGFSGAHLGALLLIAIVAAAAALVAVDRRDIGT